MEAQERGLAGGVRCAAVVLLSAEKLINCDRNVLHRRGVWGKWGWNLLGRPCKRLNIFTPPEATNTGPGFNRGYGGGARGCHFEERAGAYACTEVGHSL